MRSSSFWVAAVGATLVSAFHDTSPFILLSTSPLSFSSPQITTATKLSTEVSAVISACDSDVYVLAHQPEVSIADYSVPGSTPRLKRWIETNSTGTHDLSSVVIPDVLGSMEPGALAAQLQEKCGVDLLEIDASSMASLPASISKKAIMVQFSQRPSGEKSDGTLHANDLFLSNLLSSLSSASYTVFYTTSPRHGIQQAHDQAEYVMDEQTSAVHMELKRDTSLNSRADAGNTTLVNGPLFERYQFLTPGLFMGILAMFFLLSIAFVGVTALGSLEVSYAAFDKENGPAAQKKQQ